MIEQKITKDIYTFIVDSVEQFNKRTQNEYEYDDLIEAIIYTYFESNAKFCFILSDWDEGSNNDPYWNHETNEHSVIHFIRTTCEQMPGFLYKLTPPIIPS